MGQYSRTGLVISLRGAATAFNAEIDFQKCFFSIVCSFFNAKKFKIQNIFTFVPTYGLVMSNLELNILHLPQKELKNHDFSPIFAHYDDFFC